jgi:hypothetical protein
VAVLGEKTQSSGLVISQINNESLIVSENKKSYTISYTSSGRHPVFRVANPTPYETTLVASLNPASDSATLSQTVDLVASDLGTYRLFDHSVIPFNKAYEIVIPAWRTINLDLAVSSDLNGLVYGTVKLHLWEK